MDANYFRGLFDYNYWAHRRVWDCVMQLNEEQFAHPCDYSIGSVYEQVVHTMGAEWLWLQRVNGVSPEMIPGTADYPTRTAIRTKWDTVEAEWRAYLAQVMDEQLRQTLVYTSITGRARRETPLWQVLGHVVNHSTDHRAQTLAQIHQVGGKTIEQDLIFYTWEQR
jgi:uncharacterized damage-inducible protein DinB